MNDRDDIIARLKRELQMVDTSTLFSDTTLVDSVNDAYLWATDLHPFPRTEKAKYTTTTTDYYYDQPGEFKMDSTFLIVIDSKDYEPINYQDYLRFKTNNPNNTDERLFAMFGDQIFIEPAASSGLEMIIWGLIQPDPLSAGSDTTIFSNSESIGNEAIMRKALSDLLPSGTASNNEYIKAQTILDGIYARIKSRQAKYRRKDASFFKVGNMFPDRSVTTIPGNFRS